MNHRWQVVEPGPGRWTTEGPWVDKSPTAPEPPENGDGDNDDEGDEP